MSAGPGPDGCAERPVITQAGRHTPEIPLDKAYTLHYLEFDDQGWLYPDRTENGVRTSPSKQIDYAIADLTRRLEHRNIRAFVFVHGWHHSAAEGDRDLNRFRCFLRAQSADRNREVVGFYVAWNGQTIDVPYLENLTFWSRKNAAHHVAEGSVREFFAKIKALRNAWNRPKYEERSKDCGQPVAENTKKPCPLRTVMIGHSFGAWILYAATAPYMLETLTSNVKLPPGGKTPATARERGIADLIVLINPAFEASRYEAVHEAARHYAPPSYEPPLLVSVTSVADNATGIAFPAARIFSSILQRPTSSDLAAKAMVRTHGHLEHYLTHELYIGSPVKSKAGQTPPTCVDEKGQATTVATLRTRFFATAPDLVFRPGWQRRMCQGMILAHRPDSRLSHHSVVWNVRTTKEIIAGHNEITGGELNEFITTLYKDMSIIPWKRPGTEISEDD